MKWRNDVKKSITTILKSSHKRTIGPEKSRPRYISAQKIEEQRRIMKKRTHNYYLCCLNVLFQSSQGFT